MKRTAQFFLTGAALLFLQSCLENQPNSPDTHFSSSIRFQLPAANDPEATRKPLTPTISSLALTITPEYGEPQTIRVSGEQLDADTLTVDVSVPAGNAAFAVELFSNKNVVIYRGQNSIVVNEDNFEVYISISSVTGILSVSPETLTIAEESFLQVRNAGIGDLDWQITEYEALDAACPDDSCFTFSQTSGTVSAQTTQIFAWPFMAIYGDSARVRFDSKTNFVDVVITKERPSQPELVITDFALDAPVFINAKTEAVAPVTVTVKNVGLQSAPVFKMAAFYTLETEPNLVRFTVPGQSDIWFPFTADSLLPGDAVSFTGEVRFPSTLHKINITLRLFADSCAGEEFQWFYCRVREFDEGNNGSPQLFLLLP